MNDRAENPGMLVSTDEMCYTPNGEADRKTVRLAAYREQGE